MNKEIFRSNPDGLLRKSTQYGRKKPPTARQAILAAVGGAMPSFLLF